MDGLSRTQVQVFDANKLGGDDGGGTGTLTIQGKEQRIRQM